MSPFNAFRAAVDIIRTCTTEREMLDRLGISMTSPEGFYATAVWQALKGDSDENAPIDHR